MMSLSLRGTLLCCLVAGLTAAGIETAPNTFKNMHKATQNQNALQGIDAPVHLGSNFSASLQVMKGIDEKLVAGETIPWALLPPQYFEFWKELTQVCALPYYRDCFTPGDTNITSTSSIPLYISTRICRIQTQ
jgi:hypothetical protein